MSNYEFTDFSFSYGGADVPALRNIDLTDAGGVTLLVGGNGSGKTTLLRQLLPSLRPHGRRSGSLRLLEGAPDARQAAAGIGYVGQDPAAQLLTDRVWRELALTAENLGWPQAEIAAAIAETAALLGIGGWLERETAALSAGERQLVAVAAALVTRPRLLLLDEPCAHLDAPARTRLLAALRQVVAARQLSVVVAEQDFAPWLTVADRVCYLHGGALEFCLPPAEAAERLKSTPLRQALPLAMRADKDKIAAFVPHRPQAAAGESLLIAEGLGYSYGETTLFENIDITLQKGSISVLLGANGSGKTTLLELLQGVREPQAGQVSGPAALLPSRPQYLLLGESVGQALCRHADEAAARQALRRVQAEELWHRHPADLSGGQKQRAALALLLLMRPQVLLLDEPEAALDAAARARLAALLRDLRADGLALLVVTHDAELAAAVADRALLLADGRIAADLPYEQFVAQYAEWQPQAWQLCPGCLHAEELLDEQDVADAAEELPVAAAAAAPAAVQDAPKAGLGRLEALLWLLLPLTAGLGWAHLGARRSFVLSLILLVEAALPLLLRFERKGYAPRRLAFLAGFCAFAVAGRLAFFMLPQVKPLLALVCLGALFLGAESGLWLGATAMFLSNFFFTHGPWTPWQMLAAGASAAVFGLLGRHLGRRGQAVLSGALALLVYGPIANFGSLLIYHPTPTLPLYAAVMLAGLPFDITHAVVTAGFMYILSPVIGRRVKWLRDRYGV